MSYAVSFGYPECMYAYTDKMKPWSSGGDFDSYGSALAEAKRIANERNFPIEVLCMGHKQTVYPDKLKELGY